MDSVDDSIITTTPTDTSNRSTSESSSSEVSQPTIKLRANVVKTPLKYEETHRREDHGRDSHHPFLQTLDQDGRRLVEKTGRTAQRARSSIRQGFRFDDESRDKDRRKKTTDNYWPEGCCAPRKCRSTTSVVAHDGRPGGSIKQRHHSYESSRRSWETTRISKGYSAGDYLRHQILEDLSSKEFIGKTEDQIAEDRCNRVKAYLRGKNVVDSSLIKLKDELGESRNRRRTETRLGTNDSIEQGVTRRDDLDRIRSYLQAKIRTKMKADGWKSREEDKSFVDIGPRASDYRRVKNRGCLTRRAPSDFKVRERGTAQTSECKGNDGILGKIEYSSGKNDRNRENICRRTRSYVIPEAVIDPEDIEIRKRFYSYSENHRKLWRTKSCLTFEKKLSLPNKASLNLDRESERSSAADYKYDRDDKKDSTETNEGLRTREKHCRRTRSDTLAEKITAPARRAKRRSVSWSDKRKLHRRENERLAALADETSLDSDANCTSESRRAKTEQANLCSWREYKEKRRQERLLRESENRATGGDDRKICTTPIVWKNFRERLANFRKPEDAAYRNFREGPLMDGIHRQDATEGCCAPNGPKLMTTKDLATTTNDNLKECTTEDTEAETIIQENYLLLDNNDGETSKEMSNLWTPTISRLRVNEYGTPDVSLNYELNMIDFGYDTIPRRRDNADDNSSRSEWIDYNANSRVKKSDTFKIIDGSEDAALNEDDCRNESIMCNYFNVNPWPLSDAKSSSNECAFNGDNDVRHDANENFMANHDDGLSTSLSTADAVSLSNENTAGDYFKRVYDLLKQRQEGEKRKTAGVSAPVRCDEDTSSSNCVDHEEEVRRRRTRRKKDKPSCQGEEIVAVSPGLEADDDWNVEKLLENKDPGGNVIFRRSQLQNVGGQKRQRPPAPPIPANCKINVKDISKYFDYPNKENTGPRNGVIGDNKCQIGRNDPKEGQRVSENENEMGSNLSRHNGKGLTGRRTQSSGNLCDPKGKLNHVGKILVPCSSSQRERYKICGSLPNHLDDKEILEDEDARENNNVISDTMAGNLGGTLPHKKRALGVHFSDTGPTGTLDLVKHRSQDSLEGDPWRYQDGVDLDLVRCKHSNYDSVRKNQSADAVDGDASNRHRYGTPARTSDTKCHRSTDLDLVGVLPKKKPHEAKGAVLRQNFESRQSRSGADRVGGELSIKLTHKPDCELMKHRQFDRAIDLKLGRLMSGEPQDQGYASERSPEDEHPPSLPGQDFPNVTPESTFRVTLQKSSRGLGLSVSGGGAAGPVRVKRLFPQQPAALSNKLQPGDILLAANGVPLTGLTNYEALEVLRTTPSTVELVVCRLPGDASVTPPGAPPPPPARREQPPPPPPLRILNPLPPLQIEPCGEFDIEMTKVAGSLGFTLRKVDSSALGHYVRALVREPALSDGRIRPGDKIVAVDGATLSPMSHEEAVALLRQCGPRVKLRLYRDLAQTPVSALSPTEPDHPLRPPRTSLRQEAVDMLCDLAVRKLSPGTSNGSNAMQTSGAPSNSPRRLRRPNSRTPTAEAEQENHLTFHPVNPSMSVQTDGSETDQCSINTLPTNSQSETPSNDIIDPPPLYDVCDSSDSSKLASRPSFLNLGGSSEMQRFKFGDKSDLERVEGPAASIEPRSDLVGRDNHENNRGNSTTTFSSDEQDNNLPIEPASMPPLLPTTRTVSGVFSYKNPAYQSANPTCGGIDNSAKIKTAHSSDQDIPGKVLGTEDPAGSKGLLKWKGVMFAPNDDVDEEATGGKAETENTGRDCTAESTSRENLCEDGSEVFMVELTRGWNSRLGFSLQPEGDSTVISVVHPDSVAAKDGRLKQGDILVMVNDESVENMPTAEIIDLLRKIRGSIGITVMRKNRMKKPS